MGYSWVKKGKKLFVDTGKFHECCDFGWEDTKQQFYGYMEGYKNSADILIENAVNSKDRITINTVIFPVCFLYRQYLELTMKNIFIYYTGSNRKKVVTGIKCAQHNLMKIWNLIEPYMKQGASNEELQDIKAAKRYIEQFHELDKSSFTFRYPIDKNLNSVITKEKRINLLILKEGMEELYHFFTGVEGKLDDIKQWKTDMFQEFYEDYY